MSALDDFLAAFNERAPWQEQAACKGMDPNLFHPGRGEVIPEVCRALCRGCPVRVECGEYAINRPEQRGVWGGMSERERRRIRARRRLSQQGPGRPRKEVA